MAEADQFYSTAEPIRLGRTDTVHRLLLCAAVAAIEGAAAFVIVFGIALAYHLLLLNEQLGEFGTLFYLSFAVVAGLFYAIFAALAASRALQRSRNPQLDMQEAFYGWTATLALMLLTAFLAGQIGDFSRVSLTVAYVAGVPVVFGVRHLLRGAIDDRIKAGALHYQTIAVIGGRLDVLNFLLAGNIWSQGHKLASTLYFEDARDAQGRLRPEMISEFAARNVKRGTDHIVLVGSIAELDEFDSIARELRRYALNLLYAPASRSPSLKFLDVVAIGPNNVLRFVRTPMSQSAVLAKRAFDLALSSFGLLVLSPLFALVALAIVAESRGPVIYTQARRGFNGDTFMIWKFRSMRVTESGYQMKQAQKDDPRITRTGRFIRATSIDELPQLVNVLVGQMSLVGPRPHAVSHDEELSRELASYAHRQRIKPGITGWAQVHGFRGETATRAQIEGRVEHDIYYIDNWSLLLDIWTVVLTLFSPATRKNAR